MTNRDTRIEFIKLFGENCKISCQNDNLKYLLSNFGLSCNSEKMISKVNEASNFIYFFKNRFNIFQKHKEQFCEYIIIPSLSNPRWIVKNNPDQFRINNKLIKPSSFKSKLVWKLAKVLNKVNFTNLLFPYRFFTQKAQLEKSLKNYLENGWIINTIYTGAIGPFQKFTCQIIGNNFKIIAYMKLGLSIPAKNRILNEKRAIETLKSKRFSTLKIPRMLSDINFNEFDGFISENILDKIDKFDFNLNALDFQYLLNMYNLNEQITVLVPHFSKFITNLQNKSNYIISNLATKKIIMCPSHGDYIPWNRFIGFNQIKLIDFELFDLRPFFFDLFTFIVISRILHNKDNWKTIMRHCTIKAEQFLSYIQSENYLIPIKNQDIVLYLFLFTIIIIKLYKENNLGTRTDSIILETLENIQNEALNIITVT